MSLDVVLGDDPPPEQDALSLPTGSFVTVGFTDEVGIDGPGDDIFVREAGVAGELADVFVSSNLTDFTFLGTGNGGTTSSFDLADIGFTEPVRAVKIVGLDSGGTSPGFDVVNVQVLPESVGEATGAHTVVLAEDEVVEGLNFGNLGPPVDNGGNSLSNPTDIGFLISTQILRDSIGGTDLYDFFRFELLENSSFDLEFSGLSSNAELALLDSSGLVIDSVLADNITDKLINNELDSGVYYLRVLKFDPDSTPYTVEVTGTPIPQPFEILDVSPDSGSNAGQATITISGNQFTPEAQVSIVDNTGNESTATGITWLNDETLSATFDLTGLSVDDYDVRVTDTPGSDTAEDVFAVNDGTPAQLEVFVSSPSRVRPFGTDIVTVTYTNVGETDETAPLLRLEAEGARFRLPGESEFSENQVQFLGINNEGLAGILSPGASGSFQVEFEPNSDVGDEINFTVSTVTPDEMINWEDFRDELQPDSLNAEAWDAIYDNFIASAGNTAGEYQAILVDNANYLSQQGEYVSDANRLVGFEFQQASDYQALAQRYSLGSFGRGRFFIGDVQAIVDEEGNVTIENSGTQRLFNLREDGSYVGATGDFATLTLDGDVYRLEEQGGTVTVFRPNGSLDFIEDSNGNRITAEYSAGQLTGLTATNGDSLTLTRNGNNRITSVTDSVGRTTTYNYDATGELLLDVTSPEGTTSYTYDDNFAITSIADGNGTEASFEYDDQGRLIRESFNEGAEEITYSYDDNGEVTVTDASGATTQLSLNDRGQVAQLEDALGRNLRISYDEAGNPTRITAPDNSVLGFTYDDEGNLLSQVNPLGQRTEFTYESNFDLLESVTDPRGNAISYDYDESGNLLSINYADASVETFDYDEEGNITESVNRRAQEISYTYNTRGQLLDQNNADGSFNQYTYDERGNLTSATDSNGTTTLEYDEGDRLTQITYANGRSLAYTYDAGGRRTSMTDQDGNTVNYSYDSAGRLASLSDGDDNSIVGYSYDDVGRLTREDNGNGTYTTYTYDAAGQLTSLVNFAPDDSINSRYDYSYDELGQQIGATTLDGEWTYSYDAIGQLVGAVFASTNPDIPDQDLTYVYDAAGNRVRTVVNGETTEYSANNLNQYETVGDVVYDYDQDGNLISKTEGDNVWTYEYNNENRLVKVIKADGVETEYEYDALGNRIATVYDGDRTEYLIDPLGLGNGLKNGNITLNNSQTLESIIRDQSPENFIQPLSVENVVGEYNSSGNLVANYIHGIGLVSRNDGSESAYFDSNAIGSTIGITNAVGNYVNSYSYLPFGEELSETETIANPFEFVGQWGVMEEANGLDFMRARFYDGDAGRFVSIDPIGLNGGDENLYRYVGNHPTNLIDPEGTFAIFPVIGGVVNLGIYLATSNDITLAGAAGSIVTGAIGGAGARVGSLLGKIGLSRAEQVIAGGYIGSFGVMMGKGIEYAVGDDNDLPSLLEFLPSFYPIPSTGYFTLDQLISGLAGLATQELANILTDIVTSFDPNDIIGPAGFGEEGWLTPQLFPYTIRFENEAEQATAPAVLVTITHQLDSDLDFNTFELGDFGFGDIVVDVPEGFQNYSERLDLQDTINAFVDFEAGIDLETGLVTWTLTTIDPETGELATGVDDGFLPPNTDGDGEGFVRYTIEPQADLPTGTAINAIADIVFDFNEPIVTPEIVNTIDISDPTSTVESLPETVSPDFLVSWTGSDDGSGIASYDVFVSVDGQPFELWLDDTTETEAIYNGEVGSTYGFYTVATDNVGNIEVEPTEAQASTTAIEPGITVNSPEDINTTETGDTAEFTVVLDTQPLADVTIAISSSDETEGTVNTDSLTFTSENWDEPQTITITGVDDDEADGDIEYTIELAAAESEDNNYNGIDPDDLDIFNSDDGDIAPSLNLEGTDDDDTLQGFNGDDSLIGRGGQDTLVGGEGDDTINGSNGSDRLFGQSGNDLLIGRPGNDILLGGEGEDTLEGGTGRDRLNGGTGNDQITGGGSIDRFIFNTNQEFQIQDLGIDTITDFSQTQGDIILLNLRTFTAINSQSGTGFSIASEFATVTNNQQAATSDAVIVYNSENGNLFYNPNGSQASFGNGGQFATLTNTPSLAAEDFFLIARPLNLEGSADNDNINGDSNDDILTGLEGDDALQGFNGDDTIVGGEGNDNLNGGNGSDRLLASPGNDLLIGRTGNDILLGGEGDDTLEGGIGRERINGGAGNDQLTGGGSIDRFIFNTNQEFQTEDVGLDTITDFSQTQGDIILLDLTTFTAINSELGTGFSIAGEFTTVTDDQQAATSEAVIVYNSQNGNLFYNPNGSETGFGDGGQFATLTNIPLLEAEDFVLRG